MREVRKRVPKLIFCVKLLLIIAYINLTIDV